MAEDAHTTHCWQNEYVNGCKYGDGDACTARPTKFPFLTYDENQNSVVVFENGDYTDATNIGTGAALAEFLDPPPEPKYLWEVLVPTVHNDGTPFRLQKHHRVWDDKVRQISGGLTIMKPAVGQWVDPATGDLYKDRTIPVRFIATRDQMLEIVDMTCVFYEQLAVLCYRIADEVVIRTIEEVKGER